MNSLGDVIDLGVAVSSIASLEVVTQGGADAAHM